MVSTIIKNTCVIIIPVVLFTACVPKDVTIYQQEDELLNCRKLTGKLAELMHTNDVMNDNTGISNNSLALWYISPIAGVVNQVKASTGRDKIDNRFNYLLELKERQGCRFTDKERAFAQLQGKGRVSEDLEVFSNELEKRRIEMQQREID